jgi:hypothetical protein
VQAIEILELRELARGVALDAESGVVFGHAMAVVADRDARDAAAFDLHVDASGPGVERVFDQLLDHAGRALDDFAGRDPVDRLGCQLADSHQSHNPRPRLASRPAGERRRRTIWRGARV